MAFLPINQLRRIYQLSRQAYSGYKKQIVILIVLGFVGGILEGVGINALIPLFSFAIGREAGNPDIITRTIQEFFGFLNLDFTVRHLLILIGVLFSLKAGVSVILELVKVRITADYEERSRNKIFEKILNSRWEHLLKQKLGFLETVLLVDVPQSRALLDRMSNSFVLMASLLVYAAIAVNISLTITLLTLALGGIIFLVFKPALRKIKRIAAERTMIYKEAAHHVSENIYGVKTVKTMMVQDGVMRKGSKFFRRIRELMVRAGFLQTLTFSFIQPIGVIFIAFVFALFYRSPEFNLAALIAIVYLIERIFIYIQQIQRTAHIVFDQIPHLQSVVDYGAQAVREIEHDQGKKNFVFRGQLEFQNIDFAYQEGVNVLRDLNFAIKKGEMVGIIGPSGVGKTTLVDLILRLINPVSGQILLDNMNISEIKMREWRGNIGYVSQDIFLMNDTIRNNISFYNSSISDREIMAAAKMANIHEFIEQAPRKLDTQIGERGLMLSAGQRQRIVIARVLARKPQLLIMDEATSALDNESESRIQRVIGNLKGKITVIVIAHRLSTIKNVDHLLVVEKGRIIEQGRPDDLLKTSESYFSRAYNIS